MFQLFLVAVLELLWTNAISPKLRQIESGMRLRQICSLNLRHSTVCPSVCSFVCLSEAFQSATTHSLKTYIKVYFQISVFKNSVFKNSPRISPLQYIFYPWTDWLHWQQAPLINVNVHLIKLVAEKADYIVLTAICGNFIQVKNLREMWT